MDSNSDTICGVERQLVERYLLLIRDHYRKAEKATYFIEQRTGVVNFVGVANVRDALSHLVTLLDENTPAEKRNDQLISAEEHLRRAILEPYNIAINKQLVLFKELYEKYKRQLLPVKDKFPSLLGAPNDVSIRSTMGEVRSLVAKGRSAKAKNLWDPTWEEGVAALVEAFDKLADLFSVVEQYWYKYEQVKGESRTLLLTVWGVVASLLSLLIPLLFAVKPSLLGHLRHFLHLG
jgi:hypothetical protein